jgi:hypothetical protein
VFKSNTINTGLLKKDIVLLRPIHT